MAYIGRDISNLSDRAVLDNITASATATYNLLLNSVAYVPSSAESLTVSLNGVIQKPQSSYTVSGSTIVFDSALTSSDVIDFIIAERAITLTTVGSGSVGLNQLSATGTKDATTFLRGDNTFATVESGISWQSTIVTGATLSALANKGYWIDTTSQSCTITFPSSASVGDTIELVDYARKWGTNKIVINSNGLNYQGQTDAYDVEYDTSGQALRVVYSGATKGWIPTSDEVSEDNPQPAINFLVIAGGGGGGGAGYGGGGGAGGYRSSYNNETSGGGNSSETALALNSGTQYTVTVGAAGAAGASGSNSAFSTITCVGGGRGTSFDQIAAASGGSGGGSYSINAPYNVAGSGTANQGFDGNSGAGDNATYSSGGGGGGAGSAGNNGGYIFGGAGGSGVASTITGSSVTRAGGGGAGTNTGNSSGAGGSGGGGASGSSPVAGTTNTGSGGGGKSGGASPTGGAAGGSGVVILRMATANYSGTTTGSPTVTTSGLDTIITFTGSGSYTA
jgi:hypothetical protein